MRITLISGHPNPDSFCAGLAKAYTQGARAAGHELRIIDIAQLSFSPNLGFGYQKRTELEPDLLQAQDDIKWAEHIVIVYPVWWGSVPALLKGFIDRVFLPGFAFQKREGSLLWDKFLQGRSARIICTLDQPTWFYRLRYSAPSHHAMKSMTLEFVGIKPVRITPIGPVRNSSKTKRDKWLRKVEKLGKRGR